MTFVCFVSSTLIHFQVSDESPKGFTSGLAKVSASCAVRRILVAQMGVEIARVASSLAGWSA